MLGDFRTTPTSSWLNPKPPPPLKKPLSQLISNTAALKKNFLSVWDHIHGVLQESYFCPKLYLIKIPKVKR